MTDTTKLMVCDDCIFALANGDYSGLTDEREAEVHEGFSKLHTESGGRFVVVGDEADKDDFSTKACECCGTRLHGSRHSMIQL